MKLALTMAIVMATIGGCAIVPYDSGYRSNYHGDGYYRGEGYERADGNYRGDRYYQYNGRVDHGQ